MRFEAQYQMVLVLSDHESHLKAIQDKAKKELSPSDYTKTLFVKSTDVKAILESTKPKELPKTEIIKGFRVKTEFESGTTDESEQFRKDIERILKKKRGH